ncbi:MAG: hypothetical protein ACW99A_15565 [Candidatus Kariarchaeaceae archaeon]
MANIKQNVLSEQYPDEGYHFYLKHGSIFRTTDGFEVLKGKSFVSGLRYLTMNTSEGKIKRTRRSQIDEFTMEDRTKNDIGYIRVLNAESIDVRIGELAFEKVNLFQTPIRFVNGNKDTATITLHNGKLNVYSNDKVIHNGFLLLTFLLVNYFNNINRNLRGDNFTNPSSIGSAIFSVRKADTSELEFRDNKGDVVSTYYDNVNKILVISAIVIWVVLGVISSIPFINLSTFGLVILFVGAMVILYYKFIREQPRYLKSKHNEVLGLVKSYPTKFELISDLKAWKADVVFHDGMEKNKNRMSLNGLVYTASGNYQVLFGRFITSLEGEQLIYVGGFNRNLRVYSNEHFDPVIVKLFASMLIRKSLYIEDKGGSGG